MQRVAIFRFRSEIRQALAESGYHGRDDIIDLVREVKQELAEEQAAEPEAREPAPE